MAATTNSVPVQEGSMCSTFSPTGLGHNSRYFVVQDDVAIKVCWGDFCQENVGFPMLFETHRLGTLATEAVVLVTYERWAEYDEQKAHQLEDYDFSTFKAQYQLEVSEEELREDLPVYDLEFILEKTVYKVEQGKLFQKSLFGEEKGVFKEYPLNEEAVKEALEAYQHRVQWREIREQFEARVSGSESTG